MTKSDSPAKPPSHKLETVILKVFIHCEGCRRKVKKIINGLDGVQSVTIDSESGKVTVTGTVDSKTLIERLQKSRKQAELWTNSPAGGGKTGNNQNQPKASNNNNNNNNNSNSNKNSNEDNNDNKNKGSKEKSKETEVGGGENKTSSGGNKGGGENKTSSGGNKGGGESNGGGNNAGGGNGGGGKKGGGKKGGGGGGEATIMMDIDEPSGSIGIANKSMATVSVQTGYSSLQSAEYATHMFSDENANNCHIM